MDRRGIAPQSPPCEGGVFLFDEQPKKREVPLGIEPRPPPYQDIVRYQLLHRAFNKLTTTVEVLQQALHEHLRILDALEKRDAQEAAREMASHIQAGIANLFRQPLPRRSRAANGGTGNDFRAATENVPQNTLSLGESRDKKLIRKQHNPT